MLGTILYREMRGRDGDKQPRKISPAENQEKPRRLRPPAPRNPGTEQNRKIVSPKVDLSMVRHVVKPEKAKKENPPNLNDLAGFRIGVTGFEPAASWSRRAWEVIFCLFTRISGHFGSDSDGL